MELSLIAAVSNNGVIGRDNNLIWNIPRDLARFKKLTTNHIVIMGRKTYESLPIKPLPNRINIVITNNKNYICNGCYVAHNIEDSLDIALKYTNSDKIFVIGGGDIYKQFLPLCKYIYLTKIHADFDGDIYFPPFYDDEFKIKCETKIQGCDKYDISYHIYERI